MSNKILVTGGTGFLGAYIIRELVEKGYTVRALHRNKKRPFFIPEDVLNRVEWIEGDVLDIVSLDEAMDGVSTVIHAAALVSFGKGDKQEMYQVNKEGTANVVNMALEKNMNRLVHVSSVAALGRTLQGDHVNEERKWTESKLNTHYANSKHLAEMEVWRGMGEGLSAVIVNPSTILGFGDWQNSSCAIFKRVYDGFRWYTTGVNGFVDVEDTAKAIVMLMESAITEQRFIINGDNWTFRQLLTTIAENFNKKPPAIKASKQMSHLAWRLEWLKSLFTGKKPLLTRESAKVAGSRTYFENDKIRAALPGFSFTPLEESIKKACKKYEEAIKNGDLKL
ncbi:MAG: NAD-dependent epimerase/dehydratase family protein [Terrimonas sp.]|nr:NAD-dependent epimerase/dehydratase family protein [Terrimonas sp.]